MSELDSQINALYALPLAEFTAARNALAKSLKGSDSVSVKRLEKPGIVPWAVNQLYWRARPTYDHLMVCGQALRRIQLAALSGANEDSSTASSHHRQALTTAFAVAIDLAQTHGVRPLGEPLTRMLEALSLAATPPTSPGRLTELLQPAGLEALAGLTPQPIASGGVVLNWPRGVAKATTAAAARESARAQRAAALAAAEHAVRTAKVQLDQAAVAEARAQALVDLAHQQLTNATRSLHDAKAAVSRARDTVSRTEATLAGVPPSDSQ